MHKGLGIEWKTHKSHIRYPSRKNNDLITKYIATVESMSSQTAEKYYSRLKNFKEFIIEEYRLDMDSLVTKIINKSLDIYDIISNYTSHLKKSNISTLTLKQRVITVKNFLEYCDVEISPRKFKIKVKLPRTIRKN